MIRCLKITLCNLSWPMVSLDWFRFDSWIIPTFVLKTRYEMYYPWRRWCLFESQEAMSGWVDLYVPFDWVFDGVHMRTCLNMLAIFQCDVWKFKHLFLRPEQWTNLLILWLIGNEFRVKACMWFVILKWDFQGRTWPAICSLCWLNLLNKSIKSGLKNLFIE